MTRDLRPIALDDLGLVPALRALVRDFDSPDAVRVDFTAPATDPRLVAAAESALYRALQEALSNAVRHGAKDRVEVTLDVNEDVATLTVLDDGPGFPIDTASRLRSRGGLAGIRERVTALAGDVALTSGESGGARLVVTVPIDRGAGMEGASADE